MDDPTGIMALQHGNTDRKQEQTVDEYARANGLTIDSTINAQALLSSFCDPTGLSEALNNEQYLKPFQISSFSVPLIERPSISRQAVDSLIQLQTSECAKSLRALAIADSQRAPRRRRLELPLLKSDHEMDLLHLQESIKTTRQINMQANVPPLPPAEPLNASQDESLTFPDSAYAYHADLSKPAEFERISVSKGVIDCITSAARDTWTDADMLVLLAEQIPSKSSRPRKLTPPLSPVESNGDIFLPDPEACLVPIASDPSSLLSADLDAAEAALPRDSISSPQAPTSLSPLLRESPAAVMRRTKAKELKLEEPLMPVDEFETMSTRLTDLIREHCDPIQDRLQPDLDFDQDFDLESVFSDGLKEVLQDAAAQSMRGIEQEQLEPADATARIPVPSMDFSIPEPEWADLGYDANKHFQWLLQNHFDKPLPSWPEDHAARRLLQWLPFPSKLGRVPLDEAIDGSNAMSLLESLDLANVPTSLNFVWKQPGISILKRDEEEDILDQPKDVVASRTNRKSTSDLQALAAKRKREALRHLTASTPSSSPVDLVMVPEPKGDSTSATSGHLLFDVDEPAAPSTLLANFVNFHNFKRRKLGVSTFFAQSNPKPASAPKEDSKKLSAPQAALTPAPKVTKEKTIKTAPSPSLKPEGEPANIIASTKLPTPIIHWIEKLSPWVKITERDFDKYNKVAWNNKSVARSPVVSDLAAEADVIVSPSTGLMVLPLIKVLQRPIPGQKSVLRDRIESVSRRYERLIILVSQSNRQDESLRVMTGSECLGYSDFSGFVAGLETNTQVHFVGGGEETLSRWLVYFITTYSYEAMKVDKLLIDTETTWELLLRRAGMNAFAAQVVLSELKEPLGVAQNDIARRGLAGFINMSPKERFAKFGQLLGGGRVLQRVGTVLDSSWV
ncbi:hypothetical protein G7054_g9891 [Neopestalotiopsis clavispora]|nr:hypothetical protein G7054_g9891 [Neopestalotiopsis clavispora]